MLRFIVPLLFAFALWSCEDAAATEVPAAVMSAFEAAYPGATDVEWEHEGDNYEVEFEMNGEDMEVEYDRMGNVIEMDADD